MILFMPMPLSLDDDIAGAPVRASELTRLRVLNSTDGSSIASLTFDATSQCLAINCLSAKQRAYSYGSGPGGCVRLCSDELTELLGLYLLLVRPAIVTLALKDATSRLSADELNIKMSAVEFLFVLDDVVALNDQQARAGFEACTKKHFGFPVRVNDYRHFFFSNVPAMLESSALTLMSVVNVTTTIGRVMQDPVGVLTFGRVFENALDQSANHSTQATRASYGILVDVRWCL